ncbi:MAG TPA: YceD family protein [Burkholderiales bacterium]|nr:YceD family protein [Burkholderiales bacterium]
MLGQVVIDGLEFARNGGALSGTLEPGSLERLRDSLASDEGAVEYTIQGVQNPRGRPMLRLTVTGTLQLRCQRCLGPLPYSVNVTSELLLLRDESEFADLGDELDDTADGIVAQPKMDVAAMVEEEIILGLPYAPRHPQGECAANGAAGEAAGKESPLAALARLRK